MENGSDKDWDRRRMFMGVLLVGSGAVFLLGSVLDGFDVSIIGLRPYWPFVLILAGLVKMVVPGTRSRAGGLGLGLAGGWLLLNTLTDWSFRDTWPVLMMGWGLTLVVSALRQRSVPNAMETTDAS